MTRIIVCVGLLSDGTLQYAVDTFRHESLRPPVVIDLGAAGHGFWARYEEGAPVCRIRTNEIDVTLRREEVGLFHRLIPIGQHLRRGSRRWRGHALANYLFERLLDDQFFDVVVNPSLAGWSNGTRPLHYQFLASAGFRVPSWLVSNSVEAVQRFLDRHDRDVFVKSASHHRTISSRFSEAHVAELHSLAHCPALFQQAVHGPDVRVHVVDRQCFGVHICTRADDYRYPGDCPVEYHPVDIPQAISALCIEASARLGLVLSGIDFKICEATGEWYCLEINPMPGYSFYDRHLGGQISAALVAYLQSDGQIGAREACSGGPP